MPSAAKLASMGMAPGTPVAYAEIKPPDEDRFNQYPRHMFIELLMHAAPELQMFCMRRAKKLRREAGTWAGDDFVHGPYQYASGDESALPIWLAAAGQTYIDILDILGGNGCSGHRGC